MEKVLRDHAIHYYAVEKLKDMKSTVNYVSPAARKVNMLLQNNSGAVESELFKTLHIKFTARLQEFRVKLTRDYVLPSYDLTVKAKCKRYYTSICQLYHLLAKTYISACNIDNYPCWI